MCHVTSPGQDFDLSQRSLTIRLMLERGNLLDRNLSLRLIVERRSG